MNVENFEEEINFIAQRFRDYKVEEDSVETVNKKDEVILKYYNDNKLMTVKIADKKTGVMSEHKLASVPEFPEIYVELETGEIWNDSRNAFSKAKKPNRFGYVYSTFQHVSGEMKAVAIHTLVMSAKMQQPAESWLNRELTVNHINELKHDNRADNLNLLTRSEQLAHGTAKERMGKGVTLTVREVRYIRTAKSLMELDGTYRANVVANYFADKFGKKYNTIKNVLDDVTHKNVGLTNDQKALIATFEARQILKDIEQINKLN